MTGPLWYKITLHLFSYKVLSNILNQCQTFFFFFYIDISSIQSFKTFTSYFYLQSSVTFTYKVVLLIETTLTVLIKRSFVLDWYTTDALCTRSKFLYLFKFHFQLSSTWYVCHWFSCFHWYDHNLFYLNFCFFSIISLFPVKYYFLPFK